jgi:hypothetical protein
VTHIGPVEFDCDTLEDHFSRWSMSIDAADLLVTGTLRFVSELEHPEWLPSGSLRFASGHEVVFLYVARSQIGRLEIGLQHRASAAVPFARKVLGEIEFSRDALPFEARATGRRVILNLAGLRYEVLLSGPVDAFAMSCNTGNVLFKNIAVEMR